MKDLSRPLIRIATAGWFIVHFALTVAFVAPLNPLKQANTRLLNATIGTFFPQNWSLFAPNPLSSDQALLVRGLTKEEVEAIPTKGLPVNGWNDISTPFWKGHQRNRFTAYDRLIRAQSNAARQYLTGGIELQPWYEACQKGDKESCKTYEAQLKVAREKAGEMFAKIGSAFCRDTDSEGRCTYVAVRVRQSPAIPWSERHTGKRVYQDLDLGVYPVDRNMAGTGLYRTRGNQ